MTSTLSCLALAGLFGLAACDLDVEDLNNPGLDELSENPTPSGIAAACTGLLIGNRAGTAAANGYVAQLGILGREAYNFDAADPRFVGELLAGPLNPGSPFGGNFWAAPYANIRLAEIILDGVDRVAEFDGAPASAIKGFVHTIKAMDLLRVINTRDTIGAVIDTDNEGVDDLGAIASKEEVLEEIASLLDQGAEELAEGGDAFPFPMHSGYAGFDTPATFLTFNRAIRARVAAYQEDYATVLSALSESFIDDSDTADLDAGVYHAYSTGSGDATNGLTNPNIYAHPSVTADAEEGDQRVARKVVQVPEEEAGGAQGLTSDLKFTMYTSPEAPVPIIRNEELILLRAEANWAMGDFDLAADDLNFIRVESGGLAPLAPAALDSSEEVLAEIIYNRRYSLLFEGGHRWIDARRFGVIDELPIDLDGLVINVRYPIPSQECDGRPGEPACTETSLDS
ncbi:MAG TPA: RagB/SusD family nutrient uptake outer membrane protein [Kofleriaceae bacterium]|nr:RagB/SusD family nutrient uptake outer membrane protein [Kofleriaceae bacterium]